MTDSDTTVKEYLQNNIDILKSMTLSGKLFALSKYFGIYIEVCTPWYCDEIDDYQCRIKRELGFGYMVVGDGIFYESRDDKDREYNQAFGEATDKAIEIIETQITN